MWLEQHTAAATATAKGERRCSLKDFFHVGAVLGAAVHEAVRLDLLGELLSLLTRKCESKGLFLRIFLNKVVATCDTHLELGDQVDVLSLKALDELLVKAKVGLAPNQHERHTLAVVLHLGDPLQQMIDQMY